MSSVSRSRFRIFEWLALLVAWLSLSSPAHAGTTTISWNDFGTVLPADCDMINAKVENNVNSSAIVEFVLDTGANIGWYKGLQIVDNTNQQYLVASNGTRPTAANDARITFAVMADSALCADSR